MKSLKLVCAALAASMLSTAASADIVTVRFQSEAIQNGVFTYDTNFRPISTDTSRGYDFYEYGIRSTMSWSFQGNDYSGPMGIELLDNLVDTSDDLIFDRLVFYAPFDGTPYNLNFWLDLPGDRSSGGVLPNRLGDLGDDFLAAVLLIDRASLGLAGIEEATFTWSVAPSAAVPEPASWAMMILGVGAVGTAMRRHRKVSVRTAFA